MEHVKSIQIRGVSGHVRRLDFDGRLVDFWSPGTQSRHLLIAHDGQNVFDRSTSTRHRTWKMAQSAIRVSRELDIAPPTIIAIFHSRNTSNPWGRIKDLVPQDPFQNGTIPVQSGYEIDPGDLSANHYLSQITDVIVPRIANDLGIDLERMEKAIIGSSLGGLASLYALGRRPDFYSTCLALSTHWSAGEKPLVDALIDALPSPTNHRIWMSHGTRGRDSEYGPYQNYADQKMRDAGWSEGVNFVSKVYKKSGHNERSWAKYLDQPMKFWLESGLASSSK